MLEKGVVEKCGREGMEKSLVENFCREDFGEVIIFLDPSDASTSYPFIHVNPLSDISYT